MTPYTLHLGIRKKQLLFVIFLLILVIFTLILHANNAPQSFRDTLIVQNVIDNRRQDVVPNDVVGDNILNRLNKRNIEEEKSNYDNDDDEEDDGEEEEEKLQEISFEEFTYPLEADIRKLIEQVKHKGYADYNPINVYSYETVLSPEQTCVGSKVHFIIMIKSAIGNIERRKVIRDTWGSIKKVGAKQIKYVFTLGISPKNSSIQSFVDEENNTYNDIIQYNFVDAYYNNTLKTTGALNWVTKFCSRADFVMLVDDDYFVAVDSLVFYVQKILTSEHKEYLFMGHAAGNVSPVRSKHGEFAKWYVSVREYPYDRYPPFVNAGAMLMTLSFAQDLQIGIQFTKRFRFDDVFIGIVLYKMKSNMYFQKKFYAAKCEYDHKCFRKVLATHGYGDIEEMKMAWERHIELFTQRLEKFSNSIRPIQPYQFPLP